MRPATEHPLYKLSDNEGGQKKKKKLRRRNRDYLKIDGSSYGESDDEDVKKSVEKPAGKFCNITTNEGPLGEELYTTLAFKKKMKTQNKKTGEEKSLETLAEERRLKNFSKREKRRQKKLNDGKIAMKEQNLIERLELVRSWKKKGESTSCTDESENETICTKGTDSEGEIKIDAIEIELDNNGLAEERRVNKIEKKRNRRMQKALTRENSANPISNEQESKVLPPNVLANIINHPNTTIRKKELLKHQIMAAVQEKQEREIKKQQMLPISLRAKMYQQYEQKKEQMNCVIDNYYKNLETEDGKPVRLILLDDSKFKNKEISSAECDPVKMIEDKLSRDRNKSIIKKLPDQPSNESLSKEREQWEERLKRRIKQDRLQLDKVLLELKQKVQERNEEIKLRKEQKKLQKEKLRDRKLMVKLLKKRIKEENRAADYYGRKNILLTMKEDQINDKPKEQTALLTGSKYVLNSNPVKELLMKLISRSNKPVKEHVYCPDEENAEDKEIEELGDKMEEMCLRKISKAQKRKEGKANRKKLKSSCSDSEPSPRKEELQLMAKMEVKEPKKDKKALWEEAKLLRKQQRKSEFEAEKAKEGKRRPQNTRIMDLWRDMIRKHTATKKCEEFLSKKLAAIEGEGDVKPDDSDGLIEVDLKIGEEQSELSAGTAGGKPPETVKVVKNRRRIRLPPLKIRKTFKPREDIKNNPHTILNM